jgi:hypothetical protein
LTGPEDQQVIVITGAEWAAIVHASAELGELAQQLRESGFLAEALLRIGHAQTLIGLARRATVAADRSSDRQDPQLEAEP